MNRPAPDRLAAVGLGSSLGPRRRILERTVRRLDRLQGVSVLRVSRWYRTPPLRGGSATGWFLNGVALCRSHLPADELLRICRRLEDAAGRRRSGHWGDRTLDLDLLLVDGLIVRSASLTLPHPAIGERPFVRAPLAEVWPEARHPESGLRYRDLPEAPGPRAVPVGVVARDLRAVTPALPSPVGAP